MIATQELETAILKTLDVSKNLKKQVSEDFEISNCKFILLNQSAPWPRGLDRWSQNKLA